MDVKWVLGGRWAALEAKRAVNRDVAAFEKKTGIKGKNILKYATQCISITM